MTGSAATIRAEREAAVLHNVPVGTLSGGHGRFDGEGQPILAEDPATGPGLREFSDAGVGAARNALDVVLKTPCDWAATRARPRWTTWSSAPKSPIGLVVANAAALFGGTTHSGIGKESGPEGIAEYLITKYVAIASPKPVAIVKLRGAG